MLPPPSLHQLPAHTANLRVYWLPPSDQFPEEKRERYCRKAGKLVGATLAATKFAGCPVVPVSARPGREGRARQGRRVAVIWLATRVLPAWPICTPALERIHLGCAHAARACFSSASAPV